METKTNVATIKREHKLIINGQKGVQIFGTEEVISLTGDFLVVQLNNQTLSLKGKDFSMKKLSTEDGILEVDGTVCECKYSAKREKKNLFKRIFG